MSDERILRPGDNVWQVGRASRLAFLVDGEAYFGALARALARARHRIFVAAWEIDDQVDLCPGRHEAPGPTRFGEILRARLDESGSLRAHVLAWDFAMLYAAERGLEPLFRLRFLGERRLDFRLDSCHPVGASHHQKLVVVDDEIAFVGGFDIAPKRWDRPAHRADEQERCDVDGHPCGPFHDVQALVEGEPARALGELFRERWRHGTGRTLPPPPSGERSARTWPSGVPVDLEDVDVGIARTRAAHDGLSEVREVERLYIDSIAAARRLVYIENQYLTSTAITRALAARLLEPEGPDVVIVMPRRCLGWLEQRTIGLLRRRRLEELRGADHAGRLRILYPRVPGVEDGVFVHAKVMVVDDVLARVGSANLSNRSMGFDSECDLAVESGGDERLARGIRGFRDRLLAEHLGCDAEAIGTAIQRSGGSLAEAVDALSSSSERALVSLDATAEGDGWEAALDLGEALADPESPEQPERLAETFLARDLPGATRTPWLRAAVAAAIGGALWAAARLTPLGDSLSMESLVEWVLALRRSPLAPLGVVATYVGGSLLFVPITALIVATALAFPAAEAIAYALAGVSLAALLGFALGHVLGRDLVRRAAGGRLNRISKHLARRGVLSVAAVRLVPVAPFTLVNVIAGASRVALRDFFVGTLLGVLPGVLAIVLLEASLEELVLHPGIGPVVGVALVLGAAVLVFAAVRRLGPGSRP